METRHKALFAATMHGRDAVRGGLEHELRTGDFTEVLH